jgi:hypothetical protein
MQLQKLLVLAASAGLFSAGVRSDFSSPLALHSLTGVLSEYFANVVSTVNVFYYGKSGLSEKLAQSLLKKNLNGLYVNVVRGSEEAQWKTQLKTSSILVFDSVKVFKEACENIEWQGDPKNRYKHLVYVPHLKESDIVESIKNGFEIDNVDFLMNETPQSIELVASFMFTAEKCRDNQLKTINRFTRSNKSWKNSDFYPRKYQNLYNCSLTVAKSSYPGHPG